MSWTAGCLQASRAGVRAGDADEGLRGSRLTHTSAAADVGSLQARKSADRTCRRRSPSGKRRRRRAAARASGSVVDMADATV
jgi:hypothetical protein